MESTGRWLVPQLRLLTRKDCSAVAPDIKSAQLLDPRPTLPGLISADYKLRTCKPQKASECLIERVLTAEIRPQ
jgi:hypothetical protein